MAANLSTTPSVRNPKLLDRVRDVLRRKHYSLRTEQAYTHWIRRFILFHGKRHPKEMVERAKKPVRLPVVLTRAEVEKILQQLHGTHRLMAELLYGSGLRLMGA